MRKGAWIGTYTGIHFYPLDPLPEDVCIEDIAHSLSQICRFNGHTKGFYSVALHCLNVAKYLKKWGYDGLVQLCGLLHDAPEAYIGDVTRPFKLCLTDIGCLKAFDDIEDSVTIAIYKHFELPSPDEKTQEVVKMADDYVLALEAKRFMCNIDGYDLSLTNRSDRLDNICHGEPELVEEYYQLRVLTLLNKVWRRTPEYQEYLNGVLDPRD